MQLERFRSDLVEVADEALGKEHRTDPVIAPTGGPAGNARLTAWIGLVLLVLIAVELVTLIDVRQLLSWHVVVGVLLIPVALLKTASTGWRILRYYTGNRPYRTAGPPPLPLRVLGPLVVAATLGVLFSGLLLIVLGEESSRSTLFTIVGQGVDWVSIHQALFAAFAVVTGLHVLVRLIPALALTTRWVRRRTGVPDGVPGSAGRGVVLVATLVLAGIAAALLLPLAADWNTEGGFDRFRPPPGVSVDR